jgi:hypothetical protein
MQFEPDQIGFIESILSRAGVKDAGAAATLAGNVAASMATFETERAAEANSRPFRNLHDRLRALWILAEGPDPEAFNLTMRLYSPKSDALTGHWNPPPIVKSPDASALTAQ